MEQNQGVDPFKRALAKNLPSFLFYLCITLNVVSFAVFFGTEFQMQWLYLFVVSIFGTAFFSALYLFVCYIDKKLTKMEQEENKTTEQQDK